MLKLFNSSVLRAVRRLGSAPTKPIIENIRTWRQQLQKAGVGDVDFNIKCIVARVMHRKFNTVKDYEKVELTQEQLQDMERLVQCRISRMPLQYIVGEWDFLDITLKMKPTVFIPRPETEEFVRLLLEKLDKKNPISLLEVGCGCGAMSLAILNSMPLAHSVALDRSWTAADLAKENAKLLHLDDRISIYHHESTKEAPVPAEVYNFAFDYVISNPPYVMNNEFSLLEPEVKVYENANALLGGPDGLRVARVVCDVASKHLSPDGILWMELGEAHPPLMKTIINTKYIGKLEFVSAYKDQYNRERFVEIRKL